MIQKLYWRRDYYKRTYYKWVDWVQPILASNSQDGIVVSAGSTHPNTAAYRALDGVKSGTSNLDLHQWASNNVNVTWWQVTLPYKIRISKLVFYGKGAAESFSSINGQFYTSADKTTPIGSAFVSNGSAAWQKTVIFDDIANKIETDTIYLAKTGGNGYGGIGELEVTAQNLVEATESDYDYYEDSTGTESDYTYYTDVLVNYNKPYTHITEVDSIIRDSGPNLMLGLKPLGIYELAAPTTHTGKPPIPDGDINYLPDVYVVTAYNADGTKTAIFGAGSEADALEKLTFEVIETGSGEATLTFKQLPTNTELTYKQRIDISLFNDSRPWYSGYIIQRPVAGTTETTYTFKAHGYYNQLSKVVLFTSYENMEVSAIVTAIAREVERKVGLEFNRDKIISTGYRISKIQFLGVTAKEALTQLMDFAIDYVFGVDEYRNLYFRPRTTEINPEARFWVGQHLDDYAPTWDIDKLVNVAHVKGATVDDDGEQWLAMSEDLPSQVEYGVQESTYSLPTAYAVEDAKRYADAQISRYKEPIKSAKVKGVNLNYPRTDGSFAVRKLSTMGKASITDRDGNRQDYPISKLKYEISAKSGIKLTSMELGEQPFEIVKYFLYLDREAKHAELLQQAATQQLKTI